MPRNIRLVAVQTSRGLSPEIDVFASIVRQIATHDDGSARVSILLIQGTDERYSPLQCAKSIGLFQGLPRVKIVPLRMAYLGRTGGSKTLSILWLLAQLPWLLLVVRRWRPTVVYSAQQKWDLYLASSIAAVIRVPRVTHVHYAVGPWLGKGIVPLLRASSALICVSNFIRATALAQGVSKGKAHTVYNSLPHEPTLSPGESVAARAHIRHSLSLSKEDKVIGMVGQLREQKGQHLLLRAFATARHTCPRAHLLLVGEGENGVTEYTSLLRQLVAAYNLQGYVHFLGFRRDIPDVLAACDVFAHPSSGDACPNAVLEASVAGLPVVAWDDGGVAEIVEHGCTGLLAEPMNVDELAGYLIDLLADDERARAMGRHGRDRAHSLFSPDKARRAFIDVLRGVTNR